MASTGVSPAPPQVCLDADRGYLLRKAACGAAFEKRREQVDPPRMHHMPHEPTCLLEAGVELLTEPLWRDRELTNHIRITYRQPTIDC